MKIKTILFLLTAASLQACSTQRQAYEGSHPKESIGIIVGHDVPVDYLNRTLITRFDSVFKTGDSQRTVFDPTWAPYPKTVKLIPGDYTVIAACLLGNSIARPSLKIKVIAGSMNELECDFHPIDKTAFVLKLRNTQNN